MKKLKLLGQVLSKTEQKKIVGGYDGTVRYGTCIGSSGCWQYNNPVTFEQCLADISSYCSSGSGTCSVNYVCN